MFRAPLTISFDTKLHRVVVGSWSSTDIGIRVLPEKDITNKINILKSNGLSYPGITKKYGYRDFHKKAALYLGPRFNMSLALACFNQWIKPRREDVFKYCYHSYNGGKSIGSIESNQLRRFWRHIDKVDQAISDGNTNIVPLIIYFGASAEQLKYRLGKGLWRKLSNKSFTFNKSIIPYLIEFGKSDPYRIGMMRNYDHLLTLLNALVLSKTTLVCRHHKYLSQDITILPKQLQWLSKHIPVTKKEGVANAGQLFEDTLKMSYKNDRRFNANWSLSRMKAEHSYLNKLQREKHYSPEPICWLNDYPDHIECPTLPALKVKILKSEYSILMEDIEMDHCVANYANDVTKGSYIVLSLLFEPVGFSLRTTLGCYFVKGIWKLHQHYGNFNEVVDNDDVNQQLDLIANALTGIHHVGLNRNATN